MPTVTYNAHLENRSAALSFDGVVLHPGANQLEDDLYARLRRHPDLDRYIAAGIIVIPKAVALVNLNTASFADLVALPSIGKATAKRLMAARPLDTLAAAEEASGLGADSWAEVSRLVEV